MIFGMVKLTMLVNDTAVVVKRDDIIRVSQRDDGTSSVTVSEKNHQDPEKLRYFVVKENLEEVGDAIEKSIWDDTQALCELAKDYGLDKEALVRGMLK